MSKPALYTVSAFDATKDYTFRFRYIGVITKVEAQIWANEGGRIVVQFKYEQSIQDAVRALHTD